jgi:hypothetical protein
LSNQDTAQAAANVTASILAEAAGKLAGEPAGDNAARMLAEMQPETVAEALPAQPVVSNPAPVETPAAEVTEVTEPVVEFPDFTPQLSEEYAALLDEPEFEEEAAREVAAEIEANDYDETYDADMAKNLRALKKHNQWLEQQIVLKSKKDWIAEAKKSFPLLATYAADELATIEATSRRGFAREAAKLNEKYTKILGPALKDVEVMKAAAKAEAEKDARAKAAAQWGLPAGEPSGAEMGLSAQEQALIEARNNNAPLETRLKILAGMTKS